MNNVIKLFEKKYAKDHPDFMEGHRILTEMSDGDSRNVLKFIASIMVNEVRFGLGLDDMEIDQPLPLFDLINEQYKEAAEGCYLCDKTIDPNEEIPPEKQHVCMECSMKLDRIFNGWKMR